MPNYTLLLSLILFHIGLMAVKLAVVSGTALPLGIGRAIARSFIRNGFNILGVDNQAAEGLAAEDSHFNSNYIHHCCDVSSYDQVSEIWAAAAAALGGNGDLQLHCLVNNAALVYPVMAEGDPLVRYNIFKTVLDVNLTGKKTDKSLSRWQTFIIILIHSPPTATPFEIFLLSIYFRAFFNVRGASSPYVPNWRVDYQYI